MRLFVYCPRRSSGAFELVKALDAHRLRKFDGIDFWDKQKRYELKENDVIVCWGASIPELEGIRVLNSLDQPLTAFEEWHKLVNFGVPTTNIGRGKPTLYPLVPRSHRLLHAIDPAYCITRETFTTEYRVHSFDKRSIRAGIKVPREGFTSCLEAEWRHDSNLCHPWVKSFEGGWRVNYDGFKSTPDLRKLAHKAVAALGLTFGAVDIGLRVDGGMKVLEVDKAPRIEGGTVFSYVRAINRWVKEGEFVNDRERVSPGEPVQVVEDVGGDQIDIEPEV